MLERVGASGADISSYLANSVKFVCSKWPDSALLPAAPTTSRGPGEILPLLGEIKQGMGQFQLATGGHLKSAALGIQKNRLMAIAAKTAPRLINRVCHHQIQFFGHQLLLGWSHNLPPFEPQSQLSADGVVSAG